MQITVTSCWTLLANQLTVAAVLLINCHVMRVHSCGWGNGWWLNICLEIRPRSQSSTPILLFVKFSPWAAFRIFMKSLTSYLIFQHVFWSSLAYPPHNLSLAAEHRTCNCINQKETHLPLPSLTAFIPSESSLPTSAGWSCIQKNCKSIFIGMLCLLT